MPSYEILALAALAVVVGGTAPFLGRFMAKVYAGERHFLSFLSPLERALLRLTGKASGREMDWKAYLKAVLGFSAASVALLFLILVCQGFLPLNPRGFPGMRWDLALNTAVSFVTNTNWQAYSGEAALSYLAQAAGLAVQNFASAAVGMAAAVALIRGIAARRRAGEPGGAALGNFWVDLARGVVYVLLPLALIMAVFLASQGVPQSVADYPQAAGLAGAAGAAGGAQAIPLGPVASQVAIKMLGTNGGGFLGANGAHPFENPNAWTNLVELASMLLIPAAFPFLFGRMTGRKKQGRALFLAMLAIFLIGSAAAVYSENAFGTMEGKEARFGKTLSAEWAVATTGTSTGAVNSSHDSLSPLSGLVAMTNIMLGEVAPGGVGSGLYGMVAFALVTVFIAGLMVGRGPEYLGKKIEAREVKLSMIALIAPNFAILGLAALATAVPNAASSFGAPGPHGLSQALYTFASAGGNNGSAFGGIAADTTFLNLATALGMLAGRFLCLGPMLGVAGSLVRKAPVAEGQGSFRTDGALFVGLLAVMVLVIGALTHFPALTLGPVLEQFLLGAQ